MHKTVNKFKKMFGELPKHYKLYASKRSVNKQAYALLVLFFLSMLMYALELLGIIETDVFTPLFALFLFIILVPGPLLYITWVKNQHIVLTHEGLFQANAFTQGVFIPYETITAANKSVRNEVVIFAGKQKMRINYTYYDADLRNLEKVLTYAGVYGESPMRYVVSFIEGALHVEGFKDSQDKDSETLFNRFIDSYSCLTPGFLDDIMLYNAEIESIEIIENKHVTWTLSHIDVSNNHPENPHFDAHKTDQAVLIFTELRLERCEIIDEKGSVKRQSARLNTLVDCVGEGLISEVNHSVEYRRVEMYIARGVERVRIQFIYKEFIAGWNHFEGISWFEQKPNT